MTRPGEETRRFCDIAYDGKIAKFVVQRISHVIVAVVDDMDAARDAADKEQEGWR